MQHLRGHNSSEEIALYELCTSRRTAINRGYVLPTLTMAGIKYDIPYSI
ncbi:MAG: hypothetical protein ABSB19_06320 [Methylomonas sp.]